MLELLRRLLFPPSPQEITEREYREATRRWIAHNAASRAAGCPCGKPASKVRYRGGNVGAVKVEVWTCDEHEGVAGWRGVEGDMEPLWDRPKPCQGCQTELACGGTSGPIGGPPDIWRCPIRPAGEP